MPAPDCPVGRYGRWSYRAGVGWLIAAMLFGGVTRCWRLDLRVVHGDEANQAVKAARLLEGEPYRYDPYEHHGPTLYFLTVPLLRLTGSTCLADTEITQYRSVSAVAGILLIATGGLLAWTCGGPLAGAAAAWFLVLSNGVMFYSRYYVQEVLLTLFVTAAVLTIARLWRYPDRRGPWLALGIFAGLAHATKETVVYFLFAGVLSFTLVWGYAWMRNPTGRHGLNRRAVRSLSINGGLALTAAAVVSSLLYSSFLSYLPGVWHSLSAYITYLHRAGGQGSSGIHDKPWHYYLHLLTWYQPMAGPRWSEAPVLALAAFAGAESFMSQRAPNGECPGPNHRMTRFVFLLAGLSLAAFSLTPYKTPWNMLTTLALCCVLAGIGSVRMMVLFWRFWRPAVGLGIMIILIAIVWQGRQAWLGNAIYPSDARNPYVYAHTTSAIRRLEKRMLTLSALHPQGQNMPVYVVRLNGDYWPLPWYLRRLNRVGYWTRIPDQLPVPVVIAGSEAAGAVSVKLGEGYVSETHALRPGVLLRVFIRRDLWELFMATRHTGSER